MEKIPRWASKKKNEITNNLINLGYLDFSENIPNSEGLYDVILNNFSNAIARWDKVKKEWYDIRSGMRRSYKRFKVILYKEFPSRWG